MRNDIRIYLMRLEGRKDVYCSFVVEIVFNLLI